MYPMSHFILTQRSNYKENSIGPRFSLLATLLMKLPQLLSSRNGTHLCTYTQDMVSCVSSTFKCPKYIPEHTDYSIVYT